MISNARWEQQHRILIVVVVITIASPSSSTLSWLVDCRSCCCFSWQCFRCRNFRIGIVSHRISLSPFRGVQRVGVHSEANPWGLGDSHSRQPGNVLTSMVKSNVASLTAAAEYTHEKDMHTCVFRFVTISLAVCGWMRCCAAMSLSVCVRECVCPSY